MRVRPCAVPLAVLLTVLFVASCRPGSTRSADAFAAVPLPSSVAQGSVVLTVKGLPGANEPLALDMRTLMAFPSTLFTAVDPWDGEEHQFRGVLLKPLLDRVGMEAGAARIDVIAANGYRVPILAADLRANGYLLAYHVDGLSPMDQDEKARRRGSLQIAMDFESHRDLPVEVYKSQLVWQVIAVEIH